MNRYTSRESEQLRETKDSLISYLIILLNYTDATLIKYKKKSPSGSPTMLSAA
jgi:hypothetical protein